MLKIAEWSWSKFRTGRASFLWASHISGSTTVRSWWVPSWKWWRHWRGSIHLSQIYKTLNLGYIWPTGQKSTHSCQHTYHLVCHRRLLSVRWVPGPHWSHSTHWPSHIVHSKCKIRKTCKKNWKCITSRNSFFLIFCGVWVKSATWYKLYAS